MAFSTQSGPRIVDYRLRVISNSPDHISAYHTFGPCKEMSWQFFGKPNEWDKGFSLKYFMNWQEWVDRCAERLTPKND